MKKFLLILFLILAVLGAIFAYILYSEGAFDKPVSTDSGDLKPFMKCEAGKCGGGKCSTGN